MNSLFERAQGAHRHASSGWWRALLTSVIAGALLMTGMGMLASPASATVMLPGANAAAWPSAWRAYTFGDGSLIRDLNGDITPAGLDIVSGTCAPAPCSGPESSVFFTSDGTNAFFRMRMGADNVDATKGGLASGDYLVQIANSAGVVKAVVGVNGKTSNNDYVYVTDSVGGTVTEVYEYPFTSGSPSSAGMRWIPTDDGTGQYFLDFQVPMSAIQTVSGGTVTSTTVIRLNFGSSMAANLATINKDNMLGTSGSGSPDFTDVKPVKFVPPVYAVTFDSNGGSAVSSQNIDDGDPAVQPAAPTRAGYFFDGWFTAASGGSQWSFATAVSSATTLYAHWTAGRTVSFDSDGGAPVASQLVRNGSVATAPAEPSLTGYDFAGWFSGPDAFSFTTPVTGDLALTAHWAKHHYTVAFDSDGGTVVDAQSVAYQDPATEPDAPTKAGFDFAGWYAGVEAYDFSTPVTGGLALTAHWAKQVYTVSFDSDGGTAVDDQSVTYQDLATEPEAPTKTGFDFAGWYVGDEAYDFSTPVTGGLALAAHWAKQVYTVSFETNGGSAVADQPVAYGEAATAPTAPIQTGFDFVGWFVDGGEYDFSTPVTGPLALNAHWEKQVYTVSFDSDGGTAVDNQPVAYGDAAVAPSDPTRTGFDFVGWFVDAGEYDFSAPVTGPLALNAHWEKQVYTVSFDSNGGSSVDDQSVAYQDAASEPAAPTQTGYDFLGWFVDGDEYDFSAPVTGPLSLNAHWEKQVYTVGFDSNGGSSVADQPVAYGDTAAAPSEPAQAGYDFAGWFSGGDEYDFTTPVTGPLTVTAHWARHVYTVSFDSNGGSSVDDQPVAFQDVASEPAVPTKAGHDFAGWFSGDEAYDFSTPVTGGLTLTAHWAKQVYTVSFDSGGGTAVDDQPVAYGDAAAAPSEPTRTGYDFAGWFAGEDEYDFATPLTGPLSLAAHWEKHVYTVSFDTDGGSTVDEQPVAYQDVASEPSAPTRTGYDFQGWFLDGSAYDFSTPVTGGLTLTAHWAKQVYSVTFDAQGGSSVADQQVEYGDTADAPVDPTRTGYVFQGWLLDGEDYDFSTPVAGALSLSAEWAKQVYTVGFDAKGGSAVASQSVAYQDLASRPANPTRAGYAFQGWFLGGSAYDFATPVTGSMTLTAQWAVANGDSDGDGISDADELAGANPYHCATNPRVKDTDHDGLTDAQELKGIKMRVRVVTKKKTFRIGLVRTNPCRADTDRDGLKDGREVHGSKARHTHKVYKSNPLKKDTDRDHLSDKVEIKGKANAKHGHVGSNPLNWDTDHGGISDGGEIRLGSDPTNPASGPMHPRMVLPGQW